MKSYLSIKNWEWIVECLLWAVLLAPFIVALQSSVFPFIFPKAIYIEAVIGLVVTAMVPLWFLAPEYRPRRGLFLWVLVAYVGSMIFSAVLAVSPQRAFWSDFERMTGVVFIFHTIVLGVVVAQFYRVQPKRIARLLVFAVTVSAGLALIGLYQNFNAGFLMWTDGRIYGTFGNPIYLGGYGALFCVLSVYLFYRYRQVKYRWCFLLTAGLNLVALYLSGTRSALGALMAGGVVFGILLLPIVWKKGYRKTAIGIPVALLVVAVSIFIVVRYTTLIPPDSKVKRLTEVVEVVSGTGNTRLIAWQIALTAWRERPWFGWGPENFYFAFNQYYNPHSLRFSLYETWFDHPHNAALEALVDKGVFGLGLYLALYIVLFWMCWRASGEKITEKIFSAVLMVFFTTHLVHNLFVFDHPSSHMIFYVMVGVAWARYERRYLADDDVATIDRTGVSDDHQSNPVSKIILTQLATLVISGLVIIPATRQNYLDARAQFALSKGLDVTQQMFQAASEISGPFRFDVMLDAARNVQRVVEPNNLKQTRPFFDFGMKMLDSANQINSANALIWLMQGQLYTTLFQSGDGSAYNKAEQAFQRALNLSPRRQQTLFSWAKLKLMSGQIEIGRKMMLQAIALDPRANLAHWYTAVMFAGIDPPFAMNAMHNAQALQINMTEQANRMMSAIIYFKNKRYSDANWAFQSVLESTAGTKMESRLWEDEVVLQADTAAEQMGDWEFRQELRKRFPGKLPFLPVKE